MGLNFSYPEGWEGGGQIVSSIDNWTSIKMKIENHFVHAFKTNIINLFRR